MKLADLIVLGRTVEKSPLTAPWIFKETEPPNDQPAGANPLIEGRFAASGLCVEPLIIGSVVSAVGGSAPVTW